MFPSSTDAFKSLQDFNTNRKSATDYITDSQNKYDIPGYTARLSNLRGLVGNLQSSAEAVDPSVRGRTAGNFVTEGQNQALVNKERAPILGDLTKEQGALGDEEKGFDTASSLAGSMASALMSQDQTKYQSLLDQYNASTAQEKAAEDKRQFDATLAEQKRQADLTAKAASGGGYDLGSLLSGLTGASKAPTIQDQAYQSVQNFSKQGEGAIRSDYAATLKSANNGNAMDKLKIQLYQQNFPQYFGATGIPNNPILSKIPANTGVNLSALRGNGLTY